MLKSKYISYCQTKGCIAYLFIHGLSGVLLEWTRSSGLSSDLVLNPFLLQKEQNAFCLKTLLGYYYQTTLYYTILYYTILHYTILYYNILHYTILYYTTLYYTTLYYNILYYTIIYYTILYYTIVHYTILYYTTQKMSMSTKNL